MNSKKKTYQLVPLLFCALTMIYSQSGFSTTEIIIRISEYKSFLPDEKSTYTAFSKSQLEQYCKKHSPKFLNCDTDTGQCAYTKYSNEYTECTQQHTNPDLIVFKKAGKQQVIIENHSPKNIKLGKIFFIGDEFTVPLLATSISTSNLHEHIIIQAGKSYTFSINASENATPTLNPNGESLLLNYINEGETEDQFVLFKIKLDYNNDDIFFYPRNLEFSSKHEPIPLPTPPRQPKKQRVYYYSNPNDQFANQYPRKGTNHEYYDQIIAGEQQRIDKEQEQKQIDYDKKTKELNELIAQETQKELTLYNHNQTKPIHIKNVKFGREEITGKPDYKIDYSDCLDKHLNKNESCKIKISIPIDHKIKNDAIPVFVTYNIAKKQNNLLAVAAAIVDYEQPKPQPIQSAADGTATAIDSVIVEKLTKYILVGTLPERAGEIVADFITGPLSGISYTIVDMGINQFEKYDASYNGNKIIDALAMHIGLSILPCAGKFSTGIPTGSLCMVASIGCGLAGTFFGKFLTEAIYSNVVYRLPEQYYSPWLKSKTKLAFNFAAAAIVRVGCKDIFNTVTSNILNEKAFLSHGGYLEIAQDIEAGAAMDLITSDEIQKLFFDANLPLLSKNVTDYLIPSNTVPNDDSYVDHYFSTLDNNPYFYASHLSVPDNNSYSCHSHFSAPDNNSLFCPYFSAPYNNPYSCP